MIEILRSVLLLSGSVFIFIAALGILNMPDVLCRAHALSKALTFGISLMLLSLLIDQQLYSNSMKVILAILFLFYTIPLSGHIFALFYYMSGNIKDSKEDAGRGPQVKG